ncbi:MAG: glycosyltransferase family 4 protein [Candidatus Omnitrophica bacterium]|nr:glycosyltransferase family 4 protein [Candidatus Omnitrophota bacterium]
MKIGFDARMIAHSGIGTYIRSLLEEMLPLGKNHDFTLFGPEHLLQNFGFQNKNVHIIHTEQPIYSIQEQLFHPVLKEKFHIFHAPHYNIPILYRGKMVVTIHDVNHLVMPEFLTNRLAYPYAKFMINKAYHQAKSVICVSNATRNDLTGFFGTNGSHCRVIHESVRPEFLYDIPSETRTKIRSRYRLPEHYILSVGILKPHKNILKLIRIVRELRKEGFTKEHLVIVGKPFDKHPEILVEIHKGEQEGFIRHLENIPGSDLPAIYQMADIFAFLSLHEGFGLPILEAFASEIPVIASNVSSIPEVAGKGALLVDPTDDVQIKKCLARLLSDENLRREFIAKGMAELSRFSWKITAEETLKVYEEAAK